MSVWVMDTNDAMTLAKDAHESGAEARTREIVEWMESDANFRALSTGQEWAKRIRLAFLPKVKP